MKGNVIGIKPVDFTNDKKEKIQGTKIFVIADDIDCYGKSCSAIWVGSGTPLEKKLAYYLEQPDEFIGSDVEFSFKQNSSKVSQFDVIGKPEAEKPVKKAG